MSEQGKVHGATFGKVPPELMHNPAITDGAVRLYAHMHWRYGQNQSNFEGQSSMAKYLGVSPITIANRTNELEAHDWILTVYRGRNQKTGGYTTPFYHVFTSQADCRAFRETYQPKTGEIIAPKPEIKARKSRTGIGGKPSHHPNSSLDGATNSSLDGATNSSLDYPDSVYPDSIKEKDQKIPEPKAGSEAPPTSSSKESPQTPASANVTTELPPTPPSAPPSPPPPPRPSFKPMPLKEILLKFWGQENAGFIGSIIAQLVGTAKTGKRQVFRLEPPASVIEMLTFAYWWEDTFDVPLPTAADTLRERFDQFRALPKTNLRRYFETAVRKHDEWVNGIKVIFEPIDKTAVYVETNDPPLPKEEVAAAKKIWMAQLAHMKAGV